MIIRSLMLGMTAALLLSACVQTANNTAGNGANTSNTNSAANTAKPAAAAPTKEALMTLEKNAYEAWKSKSAGFWETFLTSNFVGYGAAGPLDRAAAIKEYSGADCDVKSYQLTDDSMMPLGKDAAVLVHKMTVDATCGGQKVPANAWAASVYVREGDAWKGAFHAEVPATDPNAPPAKAKAPAAPATKPAEAAPDALATALMAVETKAWEAWKNRDAKAGEEVMAKDFMSLSGSGPRNRADSLKGWTEPKCEGLAYSLSGAKAVSFGTDVALVTYHADEKGTCDGRPNPTSLWVASFDTKEGDAWKNAFYMEIPQ